MKPSLLKVLPFLGVALATTPAWASGWQIGFEYDGNNVVGSFHNGNKVVPSVTQPWRYDRRGSGTGQSSASTVTLGANETQDGSSSGHYTLVLRLPVGEKLPPTVGVIFNQMASGYGSKIHIHRNIYNPPPPDTVDTPGSVTLSTKVTMPGGKIYSDTEHPPTYDPSTNLDRYTSGGWVPPALVTISTSTATVKGGFYVVRYPLPPVEAKFTVTEGDIPYVSDHIRFNGRIFHWSDGTQASANVDASAGFDSRTVWLTRGSSAPKVKGDPGVTIDEARDEWREADSKGIWTTHGQTRWSYTDFIGSSSPFDPPAKDVVNVQVVGSQSSGGWSGTTSYTWSSPNTYDQKSSHRETISFGSAHHIEDAASSPPTTLPGWDGKSGSGQATVTYTLTDKGPNPATATAKYVFNLHDEFENPQVGTLSNRIYNTEYPVKEQGGVKWYHDEVTRKVTGKVTHTWKVSLTAGLKLKDLFNLFPEANGGATGEYGGAKEFSVEEDLKKTISPLKHCYFYVNIHEELKHHTVDVYEASGYTGTQDVWFGDPRAAGYEPGFSQEYDITDFKTRDHHSPNDTVDQDADYKELEVPN